MNEFLRRFRQAVYVLFKGYDYDEVRNLSGLFPKKYENILCRMRKRILFDDSCSLKDDNEIGIDELTDALEDLILHAHYMQTENARCLLLNSNETNYRQAQDVANYHKDEFFKLFSKYFFNLYT